MRTVGQFEALLSRTGSDVLFHREEPGDDCPCRTPEGFRDPAYHLQLPMAPLCNEQGFVDPVVTEFFIKASVQPAFSGLSRHSQRVNDLLGEIRRGDQIGFLPISWSGKVLDLEDWSDAGEDYLVYGGKRYMLTSFDLLPDLDGSPHHYEAGLRLLKTARVTA